MTNNNVEGNRSEFNELSSLKGKMRDLEVLQILRQSVVIKPLIVDYMIRLYIILDVKIKKDIDIVLKDTFIFNSNFKNGIDMVEIADLVKKVFTNKYDVSSNTEIIDYLEITLEEQKSMKILITKLEKNRRCNDKRSKTSKMHKKIRTDFLEKRIKGLYASGKTIEEIILEVSKSRSTVYRYLK
jgi:hypothetical protein